MQSKGFVRVQDERTDAEAGDDAGVRAPLRVREARVSEVSLAAEALASCDAHHTHTRACAQRLVRQ